jgi:SAM-dependent methyltransferase
MIYKTEQHKCFLCGRELQEDWIIWDKTLKARSKIRSKFIVDQDGKMIHGKTVMCRCGLVQEWEPMTPDCLMEFYNEKNGVSPYREIYPIPEGHINNHVHNSVHFLQRGKRAIESYDPVAKILFVGSGDEESAKIIENDNKAKVYTYEPGMPKTDRNFTEMPDMKFNLLLCNNTLEHVHNPLTFLKGLKPLMEEDAMLLISVPSIYTRFVSMPKDQWFSNAHIYHYSWYSLMSVFARAGFNPFYQELIVEEMGDKLYFLLLDNDMVSVISDIMFPNMPELPEKELAKTMEFLLRQEELYDLQRELTDHGTGNKKS